jgi:hypothetical protein
MAASAKIGGTGRIPPRLNEGARTMFIERPDDNAAFDLDIRIQPANGTPNRPRNMSIPVSIRPCDTATHNTCGFTCTGVTGRPCAC